MSIDTQKNPQISKILGIDFGKSKVGLAMADNETKIAFVYTTLKNDKNFLENLIKIIQKEGVGKIIIGISSYIHPHTKTTNKDSRNYKFVKVNGGNFGVGVKEGEKLGMLIKKELPEIEIEYQNEMFTTKMAQANLVEKGMKNVAKPDDQEAAKIILQSWLDKPCNI